MNVHHPRLALSRLAILATVLASLASSPAADLPKGHDTPEGVATDAIMAYIHSDSKAWLETLIRPIYGKEKDKEFKKFKEQMVAAADKAKNDPSFKPPCVLKVYKARNFSLNGPGSIAYAIELMTGNMFVDFLIELKPGTTQPVRYHVLKDKDGKWYFEPRPDLCPLFSMGLNDESESTEVLYETN